MEILVLAIGLAMFGGSIVLESRGQAGAGASAPSNAKTINTLRLVGLAVGTIGLAMTLISAAIHTGGGSPPSGL